MADEIRQKQDDQNDIPDFSEKFAPGELTGIEGLRALYGYKLEKIPEQQQNHLKSICMKIAERDMFARIDEVKRAADQHFYWRSMFDVYFSERNAVWEMPSAYGGGVDADAGDIPLSYAFNIFQAFGRGFITQVGVVPHVKFEAFGDAPQANRIASAADAMRRKIEAQNDVEILAEDVARLFWVGGRVGLYSRWVTDGARFGYEDQEHVDEAPEGLAQANGKAPKKKPRTPKGGAVITAHGVLELKLPINMRRQSDFPYLQLSYEIDLTSAKSMYPHIADKLTGGQPGPGEYNFDRTTRIATTQGVRLLTQTGDTVHQLPTYQRTWIRPSMFAEIDNVEDREWFEDNFPDGLMVAFIGDVYCEARNENMDDHWSIAYPVPGDGQTTPSCGYLIMSVQDALNDMTDLKMETYMKAIPAIYGDRDLFDFQAYSKEKAGPGAHYSLKNVGDKRVQDAVWAEPQYALSTDAVEFYKQLFSDIPQFLTGLFPASLGSGDPANETKGGILAMRDASRGQHGVAWKAFRRAYVKSVDQLVRIEAYFKEAEAEDGRIVVKSPGHQETIIELSDLHDGNYCCVPSSDQAFPQTFEEQQETWNKIVLAASQGVQQAIDILNEPKNKIVAKKMIALEGMVIPGAEETEKQLQEIATMLEETPVPIPAATNAFKMLITASLIMGKQPPQMPPPEALFRSSVPIDAKVDKNQIEASACQDWLNSPKGQQIREENPDGFMNVRLHFLAHVKAVQDDQMQQAKMAITVEGAKEKAKQAAKTPPDKSPSTSITLKDLGPSGQLQLGAKAGLDLTADVAADLAAETVHGNAEDNKPEPVEQPQPVGA